MNNDFKIFSDNLNAFEIALFTIEGISHLFSTLSPPPGARI